MDNQADGFLTVREVRKSFGEGENRVLVLDGIDLNVPKGHFLSIFGPNGCGKSTLMSILAGLLRPDSGYINCSGDGTHVGMVFQNYDGTLLPWRRCIDNVALPLERHHKLSKKDRRKAVRAGLDDLGLTLPLDHFPYQMSGGQKQLTCIARAMIAEPSLLLLDEPFASLDYQTRADMQATVQEIWAKTKVTTVLVSHEIEEAIWLADRLLLLAPLPTCVVKEYEIPFPRPRTFETFSSPSFVELRGQILGEFHKMLAK